MQKEIKNTEKDIKNEMQRVQAIYTGVQK